jgi:hypothetical protein
VRKYTIRWIYLLLKLPPARPPRPKTFDLYVSPIRLALSRAKALLIGRSIGEITLAHASETAPMTLAIHPTPIQAS